MDDQNIIPIENCRHYSKNSKEFTTFPFKVVTSESEFFIQLVGKIGNNGQVKISERRKTNYKQPSKERLRKFKSVLSSIFKLHSIPYKSKVIKKAMSFEDAIKYMDKWQADMESQANVSKQQKECKSQAVYYSTNPEDLRKTIHTIGFSYAYRSVPFYPQVAREKGFNIR